MKPRMGPRRAGREIVLQMLFEYDLSGNSPERILVSLTDAERPPSAAVAGEADEIDKRFAELIRNPEVLGFAADLFRKTVDHLDEIDERIVGQADNWRISRMAVVDRNILRMAVCELFHGGDTPRLVVIDEAIEIAKKYGNEKSSQFVNGILDGILKRYNLEEAPR